MLKNAAKQGAQKSVFLARYFKIDGVCNTREKEVNSLLWCSTWNWEEKTIWKT